MRQAHGLLYEKEIISKYNWIPSTCYTGKFDAVTTAGLPVQIKMIKAGCAIDMGDFRRISANTEDHLLVIGRWLGQKRIVSEHIHHVKASILREYSRFDHTDAMLKEMKNISNDKTDDDTWKKFCKYYRKIYPKSNLVKLRFKRDHSKQKRVQCAINTADYKKFSKLFPPITI